MDRRMTEHAKTEGQKKLGHQGKAVIRLNPIHLAAVRAILLGILVAGCGGGSPQVFVSTNPDTTQSIDEGQTVAFTAFVAENNATSTTGVTWSVAAITGTTCPSQGCGTLTSVTSTSVTYAAPATVSKELQVTLTATAVVNSSGTATVVIVVQPAPKILTTSLPGGTNGENYSEPVVVSGGVAPIIFSVSQGSLPPGLHLNTNGTIFGRPSGTAGTSNFTIQALDQGSPPVAVTQALSITVQPPPLLRVQTTSLPSGNLGSPYGSPLAASGGIAPITWSVTSGALPPGLSLDPTSGQISGIPTAENLSPPSFTVTATDSAIPSQTATATLSIAVGAPLPLSVATTLLPEGLSGTPYSAPLRANGGVGPFTWVITSGILPSGLSLDSPTGIISGLPTAVSSAKFSVQVTDSESPAQTASTSLSIAVGSSTSNSLLLDGNYVFLFDGYNSKGAYIMGGNLTADGQGNILENGSADINSVLGPNPQVPLLGKYTVGSDGRGSFTITIACATSVAACTCLPTSTSCTTTSIITNFTYQFVVDAKGDAQFFEADISGIRGTGILRKQTLTTFLAQNFSGNYAFGFAGADQSGKRLALAGVFDADGSSLLQDGNADVNDAGTLNTDVTGVSGTFLVAPNGRGTGTLSGVAGTTLNYAFYMASPSDILFAELDPFGGTNTNPMISGEAILQTQSSFDATSLSAPGIVTETGLNSTGKASALVGLLAGNSASGITGATDSNDGGTINSNVNISGSYAVTSNGRVALSGLGSQLAVLYLTAPNQGFIIGQDSEASSGVLEAQSGGPVFNAAALSGYFSLGTASTGWPGAAETSVSEYLGSFLSDGVSVLMGKIDKESPNGNFASNQTMKANFTVSANGRGTISILSPAIVPSQLVFYMVSPTAVRAISAASTDAHPEVLFFND
jgi:hypothetical protein